MLASRGVNAYKIQALGRWRSPLVIHYAGSALATGIVSDLHAAAMPADFTALDSRLSAFMQRVEQRLNNLEAPPAPVVVPNPPPVMPDAAVQYQNYIKNKDTGVYHSQHVSSEPSPPKAICGWAYGGRRYQLMEHVAEDVPYFKICERCLPHIRAERKGSTSAAVDSD